LNATVAEVSYTLTCIVYRSLREYKWEMRR